MLMLCALQMLVLFILLLLLQLLLPRYLYSTMMLRLSIPLSTLDPAQMYTEGVSLISAEGSKRPAHA